MKPDWKDAPEWANYLAMDQDGCWYWYVGRPELGKVEWLDYTRFQLASEIGSSWKDSLEKRPGDSTSSDDV